MNAIKTSQEIHNDRRRFLGAATMTIFDRSAMAFDNPDHVEIVIHNCRWRIGLAEGRVAIRRLGRATRRRSHYDRSYNHHVRRRQRRAHLGDASYRNKFSVKYEYRLIQAASGTTCLRKRRGQLPKP
jgi:hypothetical protein